MRIFIFIVSIFLGFSANAENYQFKNFTVNPDQINNYTRQVVEKRVSKDKNLQNVHDSGLQKAVVDNALLNGLESPLMQEIRAHLNRDFTIIRDEQRQILKQRGDQFNLGVENFSGLQWQKPMGQYTIYADREVLPAPNTDLWVVSDQLVIAINAQTFLREMNDSGLVDISEAQLGAFAGLQFHRVYEYRYFVNSYEDGIDGNFEKLILGFANFVNPRIDLMQDNEIIKKTDFMGFYAGAIADVPLKFGLELTAGVLVKSEKLSEVELKSLSEQDILRTGEFLKVKATQSKSMSVGAEVGLKLDFFNLLKLTLLSFEYHMVRTESKSSHLTFRVEDRQHFTSSTEISRSLADLMHFKKLDEKLYPYLDIKQFDQAKQKIRNFRLFNFGSASSQDSQQTQVFIPGKTDKYVISHKTNDLKYTKGWKGALWDMTFQSSIGFDFFNDYKYSRRKTSKLEFERESDYQNYASQMTQEFFAYKTHSKKRYRKRAVKFLEDFTYFPREIIALVNSGQLRGPLKVKVVMKVYPEAMFYLDSFHRREAEALFADICSKPNSRRMTSRASRCVKRLKRAYKKYNRADNLEQKLWRVKDLVSTVNKYAPSLEGIEKLFGASGLYISGSFKAKTDNGLDYKTYFEKGEWMKSASPLDAILYPNIQLGPIAPLL